MGWVPWDLPPTREEFEANPDYYWNQLYRRRRALARRQVIHGVVVAIAFLLLSTFVVLVGGVRG